jgi:type III restriction enzyme
LIRRGGKTILAAHAIGIARDAWIEKDYPVVLWTPLGDR